MKEKNNKIDEKKNDEKLNELKIELLKQVQKRKGIKKEIARILTFQNRLTSQNKIVSKVETKEKK